MTSAVGLTPPARIWRLLPYDRFSVDRLARALQTTPLVAQLLLNRGIDSLDHAHRFLNCPFKSLISPRELPGIPAAVERIYAAVRANRRICVYGDYDVDGVTGATILVQMLRALGAQPMLYVPHRLDEGYGVNRDALRQIADNGAQLVITVDCGIASLAEADEARRLGLELIVTDHHEMKEQLPAADVLVHPRLPGTSYPFGQLCGAGVAFKLAWALAMHHCGGEKVTPVLRELLLDSVALAALGVVADVVPLLDENRILVHHGLLRLAYQPCLGIQVLCESAGIALKNGLRASDIGFRLAPRINAVGRLGHAHHAVELLTTQNRQRAVELARHLEAMNEMRQRLERDTVEEARRLIVAERRDRDAALVLASPTWHGGVAGIVAGRLAEQFGRPTLLVTLPRDNKPDELAVGSGRSIQGVALHEALKACSDLLVGHGGHAAAAGFRLRPENVDAFRKRFCAYVGTLFPDGAPRPELILDAETPLSALTIGLVNELDRLEPYGADNRRPVFLAGNLRLEGEPRKIGQGARHLSFRVRQGNIVLRAIGWNMANRLEELLSGGGACCLAFTPRRNDWQGRTTVDLEVVDFQPTADALLE